MFKTCLSKFKVNLVKLVRPFLKIKKKNLIDENQNVHLTTSLANTLLFLAWYSSNDTSCLKRSY